MVGLLVISTIVFSIIGHYQGKELRAHGRIVVGYITELSSAKNGTDYRGYFNYDSKKYAYRFSAFGRGFSINRLVLIRVSSRDPETYEVLYDDEVPPCITMDKVPAEGWKEIPTCKTEEHKNDKEK